MSVYVDRLPESCCECVCNYDGWKCGINGEYIEHDGRREDCPLIEIVRCKDCKFCSVEETIRGIIPDMYCILWGSDVSTDTFCSYGKSKEEKQVTGKLESVEKAISESDESTMGQPKSKLESDLISRQAAIEAMAPFDTNHELRDTLEGLPSVGDMGEVSDGYHTFNQLYHQRAVLFATIVNQNKDKAWKSWKHEDGKFCFDKEGEWFIVGVDTPEGSYTYHYEKKYWDMFDCEELDRGKHWDGHTEEDVTRLLSLPPVEPKKRTDKSTETHACDCISRQDAIKAVKIWFAEEYNGMPDEFDELAQGMMSEVPPVEPKRPKGEWIFDPKDAIDLMFTKPKCPKCGFESADGKNFCSNCGADMRGDKE